MKNKTQVLIVVVLALLAVTVMIYKLPMGKNITGNGDMRVYPLSRQVAVGETAEINGLKVTLNSVPNDYRCPVDFDCSEGGAINTNVTLKSNDKQETMNLPSDEVPRQFGIYKISIIGVEPVKVSNVEIDPRSYVITFKVEK
jgi:hypothetical protein